MTLSYEKKSQEYTFPEFNTMYRLPNQGYWVGNGNTLEVRSNGESPITIADEPYTFQAR